MSQKSLMSNMLKQPSLLLVFGVIWAYFVAPNSVAQVETAVLHFDEGNKLYREGQYAEAITAYEKARSSGYTSGLLNYNLGNAYYRNDQLGQAIRFYEKARVYMPSNPELLHNLEFARTQTRDQFSQLPVPAWIAWWQSLVAKNGGKPLFFIGLFLYLMTIGLASHRILTHTRNPWHRRALSAVVVLTIVVLGAAFLASTQSGSFERAVVIADEVQLWDGPSESGEVLLEIHEGLVLDLVQQQSDWVEVRLPNGALGWVNLSALAEV